MGQWLLLTFQEFSENCIRCLWWKRVGDTQTNASVEASCVQLSEGMQMRRLDVTMEIWKHAMWESRVATWSHSSGYISYFSNYINITHYYFEYKESTDVKIVVWCFFPRKYSFSFKVSHSYQCFIIRQNWGSLCLESKTKLIIFEKLQHQLEKIFWQSNVYAIMNVCLSH